VEAASAGPGLGTTITVRLPLAGPVRAGERAPAGPAIDAAGIGDALRGLRVLVVDDEGDARDLLAAMLEGAGATVTVARSAGDALQALAGRPADVLLSDLAMPRGDGYELMREVRARGLADGLVAVALSARARPEDRERARAAGFHAHVAKPVEPEALAATLRRLVGRPTKK
jgi:CheY-like chemotaxis protein